MQESYQIPEERAAELLKEAEEFVLKENIIFELQQENLMLKAEVKRLRDGVDDLIYEFTRYDS
jgi:cell division protein FtsB